MKVGINKVKKEILQEFEKIDMGFQCEKYRFTDNFLETGDQKFLVF